MKRRHPKLRNTTAQNSVVYGERMTVSQLATAADEPPHAIRYYCRIGLLVPATSSTGGYRLFDRSALHRVRFIRLAQGLGFTLEEIGSFIHQADKGEEPCPLVKEILDKRLPQIGIELAQLEALHARMKRAQRRWRRIRGGIPTGDEICRLIENES